MQVQLEKQTALVITAGGKREKIVLAPEAVGGVLAAIKPAG